ncbi:hypothetical protein J1N35_035322 [Gossypium stocksii]|uniref:Uncharacterized protein n=1 Tax=Gossypium stocksii TaxID=47602 RepID=A0A9D3UTR9_9ROSI|nr:hypothetical protein J1N35_035322 [Gossypium stocksii]
MEKELEDLSLDDEEEEILKAQLVPNSVPKAADLCLIGCFWTASVIHFAATRSKMANLWHSVMEV